MRSGSARLTLEAKLTAYDPWQRLARRSRLGWYRSRRRAGRHRGSFRGSQTSGLTLHRFLFFSVRLRLCHRFFLGLARHGFGALATVVLIPVARDLTSQLTRSEAERQRERERNGA